MGSSKLLIVSAFAIALVGIGAAAVSATQTTSPKKTVTVAAGKPSEFAFRLSSRRAGRGTTVAFRITNRGSGSHNFRILGTTSRTLRVGATQTITVTLRKAGTYRYLCTLSGHASLGMKGTFTVV
jgi:plastocyanin